jgi:aspartyl-tRNA(Asn)/glutamyl-tRNA(Gln) amidotransferase subunit A
MCGVTGLKTTVGRVSTHGVLPLSPTLDTPGPLTRSVEDAAILLQVLQGADPLDPKTLGRCDAEPMPGLRRGARGLRLARMPEAERGGVDAEVLAAYDQSVTAIADLGADIVELRLPRGLSDMGALNGRIMSAESYALLSDIVDDDNLPLDEAVRPRIRAGAAISTRDYLRALSERELLKSELAAATVGVDAVLTPTTTAPAVKLGAVDQSANPGLLTRWVNLLELCGLAVPNGFTAEGLPTSLQIVCRGYDEVTALRIGWAYQDATDWHERVPPMAGEA